MASYSVLRQSCNFKDAPSQIFCRLEVDQQPIYHLTQLMNHGRLKVKASSQNSAMSCLQHLREANRELTWWLPLRITIRTAGRLKHSKGYSKWAACR